MGKSQSGKTIRIVGAILGSFILVCSCGLFVALSTSPKPTESIPTQDYRVLLTQSWETAIAALPTGTAPPMLPETSPTQQTATPGIPAPELTFTPPIILIPTNEQGGVVSTKHDCIPNNPPQFGKVTDVVDGDTIKVLIDGVVFPVRYIGIDTPESTITIEFFGKEASAKNTEFVGGKDVVLYKDVSETDRYDRLLRYVYAESVFVNQELVNQGYAEALYYPPDISCSNLFQEAEDSARAQGLGLWAAQPTQSAASGPLVIINVNKEAEYVQIQNTSNAQIDLNGWRLVSEKGNQSCGLNGVIQPNEILRIWSGNGQDGFSCNFSSPIWNNSEPDPAVLYNPQGQMVSRFP